MPDPKPLPLLTPHVLSVPEYNSLIAVKKLTMIEIILRLYDFGPNWKWLSADLDNSYAFSRFLEDITIQPISTKMLDYETHGSRDTITISINTGTYLEPTDYKQRVIVDNVILLSDSDEGYGGAGYALSVNRHSYEFTTFEKGLVRVINDVLTNRGKTKVIPDHHAGLYKGFHLHNMDLGKRYYHCSIDEVSAFKEAVELGDRDRILELENRMRRVAELHDRYFMRPFGEAVGYLSEQRDSRRRSIKQMIRDLGDLSDERYGRVQNSFREGGEARRAKVDRLISKVFDSKNKLYSYSYGHK